MITAADWLQASVTGLLALITLTYVFLFWKSNISVREQVEATKGMAEEMQQQRFDTHQPVLVLKEDSSSLETGKQVVHLWMGSYPKAISCRCKNVGAGPALDLRWTIHEDDGTTMNYDFPVLEAGQQLKRNSPGPRKYKEQIFEFPMCDTERENVKILRLTYKDLYGRGIESKREITFDRENEVIHWGHLEVKVFD